MAITIFVDGLPIETEEHELLANVLTKIDGPFRYHKLDNSPREPFCMMGVCFECLVTINGQQNQQACLIYAKDGMKVEREAR